MIETLHNGVRAVILRHEGVIVTPDSENSTQQRPLMRGVVRLLHHQHELGLDQTIFAATTSTLRAEDEVHFVHKMITSTQGADGPYPRPRTQRFTDIIKATVNRLDVSRSEILFIGSDSEDARNATSSRVRFAGIQSQSTKDEFDRENVPSFASLDELLDS